MRFSLQLVADTKTIRTGANEAPLKVLIGCCEYVQLFVMRKALISNISLLIVFPVCMLTYLQELINFNLSVLVEVHLVKDFMERVFINVDVDALQ